MAFTLYKKILGPEPNDKFLQYFSLLLNLWDLYEAWHRIKDKALAWHLNIVKKHPYYILWLLIIGVSVDIVWGIMPGPEETEKAKYQIRENKDGWDSPVHNIRVINWQWTLEEVQRQHRGGRTRLQMSTISQVGIK